MVQDAKTRSHLRVTLCRTRTSSHVAMLLYLHSLRNYQQENRIISLTCTSGVIKKLQVLFSEYTVSRNHYLSCSHLFSPKQPFISISMHNNKCTCFGLLQSSHLKNRYDALFTHTHTHTHKHTHTHTPHSSGTALPARSEYAPVSLLHVTFSETMKLPRS